MAKAIFHGDELLEPKGFTSNPLPDGKYQVRTTIYPDGAEPYDVYLSAELLAGTLYVPSKTSFDRKGYFVIS